MFSAQAMTVSYGPGAYDKLALGVSKIRLLRLYGPGEQQCYQLYPCPLASASNYSTLSYSWDIDRIDDEINGTDDVPTETPRDHPVIVNSSVVLVSKSLALALPYLAARYPRQLIWIDGICINQNNPGERREQMKLMGEIYKKCDKCIIWLGKSNPRIDKGVPAIPALLQRLQWYNPRLGFVAEHFRTYGIPAPTEDIWEGLKDVLARKWFTRVWTFQEAVLSKELVILCGENLIPSETLVQLVAFLFKLPESGSLEDISAHVDPKKARVQAGIERITTIVDTRYQRAQGFPQSHFLDLLAKCTNWKCKDPKDKFNGILGFVENDDHLLRVLDPVLNENASAADLYLKFARFWIQRDSHFQLFHLLPSDCLSSELGRNDSRFAASQLPSWCPSLIHPPIATTFWYYGHAAQYRAGFQIGRTARFSFPANEKVIQVEGFGVDRIARAEYCPWERQFYGDATQRERGARQVMAWEQRCREHSMSIYAQDRSDEVPDAYWRTIIANKHADGRPYSGSGQEAYRLMKIYVSKMARTSSFLSPREQLLDRQPRSSEQELQLMDYIEAWGYASHGRSFFTTESGRIGLGPLHTRPGDFVCIFYNGGSPYILRPRDYYSFFLIGESYVHGLMYGEALQLPTKGPDQFFTLV